MIVNDALLVITGALSIFGIVNWKNGGRRVKPFQTIAAIIVFLLVLVATILGMDYISFKTMLER